MGRPRDGVARVALLPDEGDVVGRLVPDGGCGRRRGPPPRWRRWEHPRVSTTTSSAAASAASKVSATTNATGSPTARMRSRTSTGRRA